MCVYIYIYICIQERSEKGEALDQDSADAVYIIS